MKLENSLVGEKTIAFSIAQEILTTSVNIPTIPANAKKILAIVRQPNDQIDIPLLVKLVESDPGLFTRIMQLANSPFYTEVQKIVREILDSLGESREKMTPVTKGYTTQQKEIKKAGNIYGNTPGQTEPAKKGVFGWVKSLWTGN